MNLEKIIIRIRNLMKEQYIYKKEDLIHGITRIKKFPIEQIYAALNQLINDKNEYITDMLGRIGHLINIGDYYMFQPIELENKHITRYERTHPIEYKRDRLIIRLPEKIPKSYIEEEIDIKKITKIRLQTTTMQIGGLMLKMYKNDVTDNNHSFYREIACIAV